MKNRKKQLMKIGAVIAVIAVAGIAGGVGIYKCANRFDLTVAGDPISKEEYVNCMNSVEYDTKMQRVRLYKDNIEVLKESSR